MEQRFYYINGVYYDMKTKNKSFLKYAIHLRKQELKIGIFVLLSMIQKLLLLMYTKKTKKEIQRLPNKKYCGLKPNVIEICGII